MILDLASPQGYKSKITNGAVIFPVVILDLDPGRRSKAARPRSCAPIAIVPSRCQASAPRSAGYGDRSVGNGGPSGTESAGVSLAHILGLEQVFVYRVDNGFLVHRSHFVSRICRCPALASQTAHPTAPNH